MMDTTTDVGQGPAPDAVELPQDVRILVLPRGWVVVGAYAAAGDQVTLRRAMVVRRWGTKTGLGELASGPKRETVLDPLGTLDCAAAGILFTVRCEGEPWAKVLPA